jgi:hypothetical protein
VKIQGNRCGIYMNARKKWRTCSPEIMPFTIDIKIVFIIDYPKWKENRN